VPSVLRFDVGKLDRAKRTGAGGARVPASISRTGVQSYTDQYGRVVREYRSPEAVFAKESLDSLGSIPVTVGHPPSGVTALNHRELSVGHVSDAPAGRRPDGHVEWLETAVVVSDAHTLRRIEDTGPEALTEVSMGYLADVLPSPGVTPDGHHYDAVQTNIRFNHLALLKDGHARAGSGARLRLDGNQEPIPMTIRADDNTTSTPAAKARVKVDGIECDFGSDTHVQILERVSAAHAKRADDNAAALTLVQTELGTAKATIAAYKPVDVNALVQDELAFRSGILPALPKGADGKAYDFAGKTRDTVRADAVGAAVIAEAAKLGSDAERAGYVAAHLKIKLDAVTRAPTPLHVPTVITDASGNPPKKKSDKRADAFAASFGTPVTGAAK
jgi:hypothetical protein